MASEHIGELKKWATDVARKGGDGEPIQLVRAQELISKNFGLQTHEVAILGLTADGRALRFLTPHNLRTVGQIPLSSTNSLAARTVREKTARADQSFFGGSPRIRLRSGAHRR